LFGLTTLLFLLFPYLYLWTGHQPAAMRFEEFVTVATPVAIAGISIYAFVQKWLCHPAMERGTHWRGFVLKIACWPVVLAGTLFAIVRADIPYIPTAKKAVRRRFLRLAWPQIALVAIFLATLTSVSRTRMLITAEGTLQLTSQAVWGMVGFATLPVLAAIPVLYAAWQARTPGLGVPWDDVDVELIGGGS
jgi:hypothetical protein